MNRLRHAVLAGSALVLATTAAGAQEHRTAVPSSRVVYVNGSSNGHTELTREQRMRYEARLREEARQREIAQLREQSRLRNARYDNDAQRRERELRIAEWKRQKAIEKAERKRHKEWDKRRKHDGDDRDDHRRFDSHERDR